PDADAKLLQERLAAMSKDWEPALRAGFALDPVLADLMATNPDRSGATLLERSYPVCAERARADDGAWYEMFPRSASPDPTRPGRLVDVAARLAYVASM